MNFFSAFLEEENQFSKKSTFNSKANIRDYYLNWITLTSNACIFPSNVSISLHHSLFFCSDRIKYDRETAVACRTYVYITCSDSYKLNELDYLSSVFFSVFKFGSDLFRVQKVYLCGCINLSLDIYAHDKQFMLSVRYYIELIYIWRKSVEKLSNP